VTCVRCYRHLYYTDWGKTASVVRTQLDGSNPTVIKKDGLNNPNGIAIANNTIYVTDSHYKTRVPANARTSQDGSLYSMNLNGGGWTDELSTVTTKLKVCSRRHLRFLSANECSLLFCIKCISFTLYCLLSTEPLTAVYSSNQ